MHVFPFETNIPDVFLFIYLRLALQGGNVLVNEFGVAKLADFGCSKRMGNDGTLGEQSNSALKGTPYFMAPEVRIIDGGYDDVLASLRVFRFSFVSLIR